MAGNASLAPTGEAAAKLRETVMAQKTPRVVSAADLPIDHAQRAALRRWL